jgi:hypothetical protein
MGAGFCCDVDADQSSLSLSDELFDEELEELLPEEFELLFDDELLDEFELEFELLFEDELELLFEFELLDEFELLFDDEFELEFEFEFDPPRFCFVALLSFFFALKFTSCTSSASPVAVKGRLIRSVAACAITGANAVVASTVAVIRVLKSFMISSC